MFSCRARAIGYCFSSFFSKSGACRRPLSVVRVTGGDEEGFTNRIVVGGKHTMIADEPAALGGRDMGPSPYEILCASLGSCTSITMTMYARRKSLKLEGVDVEVDHDKVYAKDCEECEDDKGSGKIDKITRKIALRGDLTEKERARLMQIANLCPVHKTLESSNVVIVTEQIPASPSSLQQDLSSVEVVGPFGGRRSEISPGFEVVRVLPYRKCRSCGPFVFLDHFGPWPKSMDVGPHPHIGLCTLTYLYSGEIIHRDSTGAEKAIVPGQVNWMVAGKGVVHSERGQDTGSLSHGLQLWVALPKEREDIDASFHYSETTVDLGRGARLVVGNAFGQKQKNIPTEDEDMFLIDVDLSDTKDFACDQLSSAEEIGVYCVSGGVDCVGFSANTVSLDEPGSMVVFRSTEISSPLKMLKSTKPNTRIALLGGKRLPEKRHMFWNYVSHDKDKIRRAAEAWDAMDRSVFPPVVNESNTDSIPNPPFPRV